MKSSARKKLQAKPAGADRPDPAVAAVFDGYPKPLKVKLLALRRMRAKLLAVRKLILDTARKTEGVGAIEEALKWGQPSYLTTREQERQHHPDRPRQGRPRPSRGLLPLPDQPGRDLPRTLSGPEVQRQPRDPARCQRQASRGRAPPLRGAGVDVSSRQAQESVGWAKRLTLVVAQHATMQACPPLRAEFMTVGTAQGAFAHPTKPSRSQ